ncbi:DMT family transporter [Paenibacillus abyssi]
MSNLLIYLMLIGSAMFWGSNFNLGKLAVETLGSMSVVAWRFTLAAIGMMIFFWWKERPVWREISSQFSRYFFVGFIGIFGTNALVFIGLNATSSVNASLITAANPSVTVALSALLLKDRITYRQAAGIAISFFGVLFVITGGEFSKLHAVSSGDLLVFAGNACWAAYGVLGRKLLPNSTPLATSAMTMLIGAICFLPFLRFSSGETEMAGSAAPAWGAVVFMAVFGTVLAYLWWNQGIAAIGANRTAIFFNLVPVTTMLIAVLTGSSIHASQFAGVILVLSGVFLSSYQSAKSRDFPLSHHLRTGVGKSGK